MTKYLISFPDCILYATVSSNCHGEKSLGNYRDMDEACKCKTKNKTKNSSNKLLYRIDATFVLFFYTSVFHSVTY